MIIHSKFKDYYDVGLSYGVDTTLHWNRETKEIDEEKFTRSLTEIRIKDKYLCFDAFSIIVCGIKYKGVVCRYNYISEYFYDIDSLSKYINKKFGDKIYNKFANDVKNKYYVSTKRKLKNFFEKEEGYITLCEKYNTCIIACDGYEDPVTINIKLEDYQFYKIWDSVTCYQNIVNFMSNYVLIKQLEITVIEDKYKIKMHGFDNKTSFRKASNNQK